MRRLFFVCRRILVAQQREIGDNTVAEAGERDIPIEPPAWVLLPKEKHEYSWHYNQARRGVLVRHPARILSRRIASAEQTQNNCNRDDCEDSKQGGDAIQWSLGEVDAQVY